MVEREDDDLAWIVGLGLLGGIGFTVAFSASDSALGIGTLPSSSAKLATILAAAISGFLGFIVIRQAYNRG